MKLGNKFKFAVFIIFLILVVLKPLQKPGFCNIDTAFLALKPRIFAETTADGIGQNPIMTRFFHNKVGILSSEFARCYFNLIDPYYLYQTLGLIGFFSWLYLGYFLISRKLWPQLLMLLLFPVLSIIHFVPTFLMIGHKSISAIGLFIFLKSYGKKPK